MAPIAATLCRTMLIAVWLALAGPVVAADSVDVSADQEGGFGRLVLAFPEDLPDYSIHATTGVLVVNFDRAVAIDLGRVAARMPAFIAAARRDPDGRAIRFALAQPVTVNTMEAGERLFVDLLPRDWAGLPPGLPQSVVDELARRAEESERRRQERERLARLENAGTVELRIGQLPTFTRLVFQWPEPVAARIDRRLETVRLFFEDFGRLELSGVAAQLPAYVVQADAENGADGLEVVLVVDPESGVRGFQEESTYVVDVSAPDREAAGEVSGFPELAGVAKQIARFQGVVDEASTVEEAAGGEPEVSSLARPMGPEHSEGARSGDTDERDETSDEAPPVGLGADRPMDGAAESVRVEARRFGASARLVFPFEEEVTSAVFEHAGSLWLVFDTSRSLDVRGVIHDLSGLVADVDVTAAADRTVVRLVLDRPLLSTVETERTSWIVTLGDSVISTPKPLTLGRTGDMAAEARVIVELPGAHAVHQLRDPETRERMSVVTAAAPAHGLAKPHNFVDFSARPTLHGLAIRHISDDVEVSVEDTTVTIMRPHGLALSPVGGEGHRPLASSSATSMRPGYFDIGADGMLDPGVVHRMVAGYVRAVAQADEDKRVPARLRLAQALLASDLGAEALGQLRRMAEEDPSVLRDPQIRAMRGVALAQMHRSDEALTEFGAYGLSHSTDIALWRGFAKAQLGRWREAKEALVRGEPALASYSAERRRMFGVVATRAALELGETAPAAVSLAQLREIASPDDPELALLDGRLAEAVSDWRHAIRAYDLAERDGSAEVAAEARLRRVIVQHRTGAIDDSEAIDRLETLAVMWRGDEMELQTLRHLSRLQAAAGNHRRAFELMKSATIVGPDSPTTRALQDDMNRAFETLFLEGGADDMPAVESLALYYDFRELTPIGRKGDEIIRWLAGRLIDVDLLDQAAELLTHQVEHRLHGAARAQVAARLAMVHLMNRDFGKALTVLSRTRQAVLPRDIMRQRALVEARALSETGRHDLALDILNGVEEGAEADRLRADTLWRGERWQEAGEAMERLLGDKWHTGQPLDTEEQNDVLRTAIAYVLAEDSLGIDRLRAKFAAQMAETDRAGAFEAVTRSPERDGVAFNELVREIAGLDTLDAFLREYRMRYDEPAEGSEAQQS